MWPDDVDEVIGGDQVFALGIVTPARGVVVSPLTNFAVRDRDAAVLSNGNTSVGTWKKLERIRSEPRVALAFHTREHSASCQSNYVLAQGRASFPWPPPDGYVEAIRDRFDNFGGGLPDGRIWRWWLRDWAWRTPIDVAVERIAVWPDLQCTGARSVYGTPLPDQPPPPQDRPGKGTAPRVSARRVARQAKRQPNVLLGWVAGDGHPMIAPVSIVGAASNGVTLSIPANLLPAGGRRAGLVAHAFSRFTYGQTLRKHTGWLEVPHDGSTSATYSPHTRSGYRFPASRPLFFALAGGAARLGIRQARRTGFLTAERQK